MKESCELGRLMALSQRGDKSAYNILLRRTSEWLRRYYINRLPSHIVDDAIQDAIMAVHEKRHTYDPSRSYGSWLAGIARHKWIDCLRKIKKESCCELPEDVAVRGHEGGVVCKIILTDVLKAISPAQADVIRLVKLNGFSLREAAEFTGQSYAMAKVNVHRGMRRLSAVL
jgi:RNA polymerase sigma factor (sigma-70 family)